MKHYLVGVQCALEYEGKLLIIKRPPGVHAGGLLAFPGGKVDEFDEPHHRDVLRSAVRREIKEELGLNLEDPIEYVTSSFFVDSRGISVILSVFYCKLVNTPLTIIPNPDEVPEYYWMNQAEINHAENAPEWLKRYVSLVYNEIDAS